jgi:hypothetical protein
LKVWSFGCDNGSNVTLQLDGLGKTIQTSQTYEEGEPVGVFDSLQSPVDFLIVNSTGGLVSDVSAFVQYTYEADSSTNDGVSTL